MFVNSLWKRFTVGGSPPPLSLEAEAALKVDLFSADQLKRYAGVLAASHKVLPGRASNDLLDRLSSNEAALRKYHELTLALDVEASVTPAGVWLLDNFFMIEEQILMARRHLPSGFSRELPRLANGPSKGLPRVYEIARGLIYHLDAQVDVESATVFLEEYQKVVPLRLGELWAVPIMLRLSLLEHLRRVADSLLLSREHRRCADHWVDEMERVGESEPSHVVIVLAEMARASVPLSHSFVARFCQRLARKRSALQLAKDWLGQKLDSQGLDPDLLVMKDSQTQAENQITVRNSISSLRQLGTTDWRLFVEEVSLVDRVLRSESAGVYPLMEFATRDRYRHAIEAFSMHGRLSEEQVAQKAIELAEPAVCEPTGDNRASHVGYYLIDEGSEALAQAAAVRWPFRTRLESVIKRAPLGPYLGSVLALTALATSAFCVLASFAGLSPWWITLLAIPFVLMASQMALGLVNWTVMQLIQPRLLPRMDFSLGDAPECNTLVVIPGMLTSAGVVDSLLERLELHYLANRDNFLQFALLTDFRDAPTEISPGDDELLDRARQGIERLDRRYGTEGKRLFHLFHRPRIYNEGEDAWIGRERKRGKLADINAALRGRAPEAFSTIVGGVELMPHIKYVITLDADTQLPRDAARLLVASMAHPLNRPVIDRERGVVVRGYGILQPRVGVSLPSARLSWFVRLFAGNSGIDPYTRAVSDAYQDLFGEGTFIGKGIFDVDAFESTMRGRFADNSILSHDLIESNFARSGLVSDVELIEAYPSRYNADIDRRHRWIRGDWQLIRWIMPTLRGLGGGSQSNPLSGLSRWKILDNLRRSLVPAATVLFLLIGWILGPAVAGLVGACALLLLLLLPLVSTIGDLFRRPSDLSLTMHLRLVKNSVGPRIAQVLLAVAFIAYEAAMCLDAILRTMFRLFVTGRNLLQWKTSGETQRAPQTSLASFYATMWVSPAVALSVGLFLAWAHPLALAIATPFLMAWIAAPLIAWWISLPIPEPSTHLNPGDLAFLHQIARKTWWYFDRFVTAEDNWLPPDNYQERPAGVIASRTSPTNIGISLVANLAGYDLGYLSAGRLVQRTQDTLATLERLEKYRGHLFNWYDTRSLRPLEPAYVSTVDSGNLAAMLMTLASGLRELPDARILPPTVMGGLRDTVAVLRGVAGPSPQISALEGLLSEVPTTESEFRRLFANVISGNEPLNGHEVEPARIWARNLRSQCEDFIAELDRFALPHKDDNGVSLPALSVRQVAALTQDGTEERAANAMSRLKLIEDLALECEAASRMDWEFLFDEERKLFTIGYNHTEQRMDPSYYDLLASEARLGSFVAIAQGIIDEDHWFSLGRLMVASRREAIMISWSGSMFEYLMPQLLMPNYDTTLIGQTCAAVVDCQIDYGVLRGVPWGVSESGYNRQDAHFTYQYRAFGVPGLGLKRGLGDDVVIAPYASAMALIVAPRQACANLKRLAAEGQEGAFGFYEAVDYTPSRLPPNQPSATVYSYMGHHQGMTLLALVYLLADKPMQRRFAASPILKAAELLLHERMPGADPGVFSPELEYENIPGSEKVETVVARRFSSPNSPAPEVHLLSNGHYHLAITNAGGGFSRWNGLDVTRWREDPTCDASGFFIYVRDVDSSEVWSIAHQPTLQPTNDYEAIFAQGRAEFRQRHAGLSMHTEIGVSPEDDIEVRRVTITNRSHATRCMELTSYAEIVMAPGAADLAHPAFSNLFVQTAFEPDIDTIFCNRRARSHAESPPWMIHLIVGIGGAQGEVSCETDRVRFLGRMETLAHPAAMQGRARPLSNTTGSVLDPIVALRRTLTLKPGEKASVLFLLGMAPDRQTAEDLSRRYQNPRMAERVFELAWTHSQVTMGQLNTSEAEAQLYGRLSGALIYSNPACRAKPAILRRNQLGQSALWAYGVSGDAPIVFLSISDIAHLEMVVQLVKAHSYWRLKGLPVELVIVNKDVSSYRQTLHDAILSTISLGSGGQMIDKPGGIFLRRHEQIADENLVLLQSVARIVLDAEEGSFADLVQGCTVSMRSAAKFPQFRPRGRPHAASPIPPRTLVFENGTGGFTPDGREYVITLQPGQSTPMPWVNVIANPFFGTVISESGGAYTWVENAREFRLTPWNNDPIQDSTGEAFYIRDDETGEIWSPTPLPIRGATPYVIRHGFGYSVFEHSENGISTELTVYVAMDAPIKFAALKVTNVSGRPRQISATAYLEWVLGDVRGKTLMHVRTEIDAKTGVLLAQNSYNTEFPCRIALIDANRPVGSFTGDRREFIGRNGNLASPEGLRRKSLSGKVGAGLDPCAAVMVPITLDPGESKEIRFHIGVGRSHVDVHDLVRRFRVNRSADKAREEVHEHWNRVLGTISVETPEPAVNLLANGWLLYQTISCRLWARTGFFQSGGAYGFRDQLQDCMALVHAEPALVRAHLLRAAAKQFTRGDVLHWWHPPVGRGVRTHFSDDFLWLPYVLCHYVSASGDLGVMDEIIPFIEGREVRPEEDAYFDLPVRSDESASLYRHCVLAIENGLRTGSHGLPLMGGGDWNDGMNRVGEQGRGESVWLAFFLYSVLRQFADLAEARGDSPFAGRCREHAAVLQQNIEKNAWDGKWYLRAFFDNGEALGSHENMECQIDSIAQSWAVISGAADAQRTGSAMQAVDERLVMRDARLIRLFRPSFDKSELDPGYIKGYIPGVRENGGQYTHAAIWVIMAFALMGDHDRAWELLAMVNPINHTSTRDKVAVYQTEPYVIAADVYAIAPHTGRGGWTWYTGSAAWMYRLIIETLLGIIKEGDSLRLTPRLPKAWETVTIHYRFRQATYRIEIRKLPVGGVPSLSLDGSSLPGLILPLNGAEGNHEVRLEM